MPSLSPNHSSLFFDITRCQIISYRSLYPLLSLALVLVVSSSGDPLVLLSLTFALSRSRNLFPLCLLFLLSHLTISWFRSPSLPFALSTSFPHMPSHSLSYSHYFLLSLSLSNILAISHYLLNSLSPSLILVVSHYLTVPLLSHCYFPC